jgi:hypothetical protein
MKKGIEIRQVWTLATAMLCMVLAGCINVRIIHEGQPGETSSVPPPPPPIPPGGTFVPVQGQLAGPGSTTVCNFPVSSTRTVFTSPATTQIPPTGKTGFLGSVLDVSTGTVLANTDYYLQYAVNAPITGCCTIVSGSGTLVSCNVTAGLPYRFTAFFKTGHVPPTGHLIQLSGQWTP